MPNIFDVEAFKAAIGNGGARPNQFRVFITAAPVPVDIAASYLCSATSLPGQTMGAAIAMYRGREVKFAGDRTFAPWTTTFMNDTSMRSRALVEQWMQVMESRLTKVGATTPINYYGALQVDQLNKNGAIIRSYAFTDVFPIDISEVALDYGANDQISTFSVTWQYQQFFIVPPVGPSVDAPADIVNLAQ